ncbi:MAG: hypothetical protein H7323_08765, partial [Frankiales bacterium]|nr:hypothetical protein [Frankiales bacterium]
AQAQSQLQTGTQDQQQAQAELALALQDDRDEQVLAMSAREVPATVRLTSLALMTSVAGAYALRRRVAVRPVRTPR